MNLYLVSQNDNNNYDTYDAIIVCAENEEDAKSIAPNGKPYEEGLYYDGWAISKESISCEEIGTANEKQERGVILASYNAG